MATTAMTEAAKQNLTVVGLAPFTGVHGHVGRGIEPAVQLALQDIHDGGTLLTNYRLNMKWIDTKV